MPVPISGLSTDIDIEGVIKKLVDAEKKPIERLKHEQKKLELQKEGWRALKGELKDFNIILKRLYGFERVFKQKEAIFSKEEIISAEVSPKANIDEKYTIKVLSIAKPHKIKTDPVEISKKFPAFKFKITVGDKEIEIDNFKGGNLKTLFEVIEKKSKGILDTQIFKIDPEHYVGILESLKTGKKNRIKFSFFDNTGKQVFKEIGLVPFKEKINQVKIDFEKEKELKTIKGYKDTKSLLIEPGEIVSYTLDTPFTTEGNGGIEFVYLMQKIENKEKKPTLIKKKTIGKVKIKDVTIHGAEIIINEPQVIEVKKENEIMIYIEGEPGEEEIKLMEANIWKKIKKNLSLNKIEKIRFVNNSTARLLIDDVILEGKKEITEKYKNEIQAPENAVIEVNGVKIERESNDIDDVIDGIKLHLKKVSKEPVEMKIVVDRKKIKDTIKDFVDKYNEILKFLIEAGKTSKGEKPGELKKEDRGLLTNDLAVMNLRSKMRAVIANSYRTSLGDRLALLMQIGVSTGEINADWETIKEGYLVLNEEKLDKAIDDYGDKIGELFGYDSNGDKIIDTGVAFSLSRVIRPYIMPTGIISGKIRIADIQIKDKKRQIEKKEEWLEKYEQSLREKFGKMESTIQDLKGSAKSLDYGIPGFENNLKKGKQE